MQGHESQQSAPVVASIATLLGNSIKSRHLEISQSSNMALADIVLWDVRLINNKDTWPSRQHYSFLQLFPDPTERVEAKGMVHGYLGRMASREMEKFFTEAELKRLAHQHDGVWIAPTRSTFKSCLPDIFSEMPYIVHQNSPLAWAILMHIHKQQDQSPLKRSSTSLHRQKNTLYLESL